jgi:hypothetical protein
MRPPYWLVPVAANEQLMTDELARGLEKLGPRHTNALKYVVQRHASILIGEVAIAVVHPIQSFVTRNTTRTHVYADLSAATAIAILEPAEPVM